MPTANAPFQRKGNVKYIFLTTAPASLSAPTVAEIGAGTDLTPDMDPSGVEGFATSTSSTSVPNLVDTFEPQIVDTKTPDDTAMVFNKKFGSTAVWDLFTEGDTRYIAFCPEGVAATDPVEVWTLEVTDKTWQHSTGNQKFRVAFSVPAEPAQGAIAA